MRGHVGVEVGRMPEGLVANSALVRRGRTVGCLVFLQVGLLSEPLVADGALERTLTCGAGAAIEENANSLL